MYINFDTHIWNNVPLSRVTHILTSASGTEYKINPFQRQVDFSGVLQTILDENKENFNPDLTTKQEFGLCDGDLVVINPYLENEFKSVCDLLRTQLKAHNHTFYLETRFRFKGSRKFRGQLSMLPDSLILIGSSSMDRYNIGSFISRMNIDIAYGLINGFGGMLHMSFNKITNMISDNPISYGISSGLFVMQ